MKFNYIVAVVIWTTTVTATSESDSHGNWSNEKGLLSKENYNPEVPGQSQEEVKNVEDRSSSTLNPQERIFNDKSLEKGKEETSSVKTVGIFEEDHGDKPQYQFSKQIVQPYVLPLISKPIRSNSNINESLDDTPESIIKLDQSVNNESSTAKKYVSVRESSSNDLAHAILEENLEVEAVGDFRQRVQSSLSKQRNRAKPTSLDLSSSLEDHRKTYRKNVRSQNQKKSNNSDSNSGIFPKERLPFTLVKNSDLQKIRKEADGEISLNISTIKDVSSSTSGPILSLSLGKFSGPIVVPDLPRQKKYSYTTADYSETNEVPKIPAIPIENPRSKISENNFVAASQVVLNPLQVGVALMNAGQDLNLPKEQENLSNEQTDSKLSNESVDKEELIQNDASDSNSSFQEDQLSEQEQISEVVAPGSPTRTVEIQKSVEIYHTAPVQEIHYPVEFIPYVQQLLAKQRAPEDTRRPWRNQSKDRRPGQSVIYRSNEFAEEGSSVGNQNRGRYEYNLNENDVTVDQSYPVQPSADVKPVFEAPEQPESPQMKQSNIQGIPEYESSKVPSSSVVQSTRIIDTLSSLVNLENLQDTQEVSQGLQSKIVNEVLPAELNVAAPPAQQSYTVDKVERKVPVQVEKIIEKQVIIPQPFPVHVPVDRVVEKQIRIPYPIHVEKVIEKKVPFAIQRFVLPLPMHFRIPQPVPVEKVVEKQIPIPFSLEKNKVYSLENSKLIKIHPGYNIQNDGNYQQQLIKQNYQSPLSSLYENEQNHYNSTGQFYGAGYVALNRPLVRQPVIHVLPKKFGSYSIQYPHSSYSLNGNNGNYGKDVIKDEYVGPVPRKVLQNSVGMQSKALYSSSDIQATLRRTRQEAGNTGSFRQSKMEYGFKPPMVPSVQYDEQTASKSPSTTSRGYCGYILIPTHREDNNFSSPSGHPSFLGTRGTMLNLLKEQSGAQVSRTNFQFDVITYFNDR